MVSRSAFRVGHGEGQHFAAGPLRIGHGNDYRVVLADIDLELLVARHGPLEARSRMIRVVREARKVDRLEATSLADGLTLRSLLGNLRRVVDGTHFEASRLRHLCAFRVSRRKRDVRSAIPELVRDSDGRHLVRVDLHI